MMPQHEPHPPTLRLLSRRGLLEGGLGLGAVACQWLLARDGRAVAEGTSAMQAGDAIGLPHHAPKAKRVVHLFMSGGPSHIDMFDPKPRLNADDGKPIPKSIAGEFRFAMIRDAAPIVKGSPFTFTKHGRAGGDFSDLVPHIAKIADEITVIRSMVTDTVVHDPACWLMNSGSIRAGMPTMGAWLSWGLGNEADDLPAFVVLTSHAGGQAQPLLESYWGSGFLPSQHQGVRLRSGGDPILFVSNPQGVSARVRRRQLDALAGLNEERLARAHDPEIAARIATYELAYRMQTSVPGLVDISAEPKHVHEAYGTTGAKPSFANNCLLARRLLERGVRFVQVYEMGWDQHGDLVNQIKKQCAATDRASAALVADLRDRGLLDDTLVIWSGEFGRTPVAEAKGEKWGRDHHPYGFTAWVAGGGFAQGKVVGATDDFGWHAIEKPVHVHDLHATSLHLLGIDHERFTFRHQGRDFRLTDVAGSVIDDLFV